MNSHFYGSNQSNSMNTAASMSSNNQMNRLAPHHHSSHRNSVGSNSSSSPSAESSSTSIVDENSPVGGSTAFHHPNIPRYSSNPVPQYPYNMDAAATSSHVNQTSSTTPLINAAAILNRMSRPNTDAANQSIGGSLPIKKRRPVPVEHKDPNYWEKRRKNNESAKKSRDSKREKENHMAMKISYLERENFELTTKCACLMQENEKLRSMLIAAQTGGSVPST